MGSMDFLVLVQKNVYDNWEAALEYNPESFARVVCQFPEKPLH
jgi:hypothetical protein